jgi:hypothetical protein
MLGLGAFLGGMFIPAELVQRVASGRCMAFVGSGLSQGAGLPGWNGALKGILSWTDEKGHSLQDRDEIQSLLDNPSADLLMVAAELSDQLGESRYRQALTAGFCRPSVKPTDAHRYLVSVPFAGITTTNYDKLIETAYTANGFNLPLVCTHAQPAELASIMAGERTFILKSHGDIDQIDTVILGRRDYQDLLLKAAYQQCMSSLCSRYTLLFIGFSLTDPDLRLTLDFHRAAFGGQTVNHYALMPELAAGEVMKRRFQKDYGITFLSYTPSADSHPEIELFLKDLSARATSTLALRTQTSQLTIAQHSADAQIVELDRVKDNIGAAEHLRRLAPICKNLWENGARKQAWTSIIGPFSRDSSTLKKHERIEIGIAISTMIMEDVGPTRAAQVLRDLVSDAEQIHNAKLQLSFWELWAQCLLGLHDLDGARTAVERAIALAPETAAVTTLKIRTAEANLLSGRLREADLSEE